MRFTGFKTKLIFTLGFYIFFWRYGTAKWLRDEFAAPLDPAKQVWAGFIPIYGIVVYWRYLTTIRSVQQKAGMGKWISPARAFWWSSLWFAAGPYINKHLNALDAFAKGRKSAN